MLQKMADDIPNANSPDLDLVKRRVVNMMIRDTPLRTVLFGFGLRWEMGRKMRETK